MKVLHVCFADKGGGAMIGAYRSHTSMLSQGVNSTLLVARKKTEDPTVIELPFSIRLRIFLSRKISGLIFKLQLYRDRAFRSFNLFPTGIHKIINETDADIVQLHWIGANTMAIQEIKKIKKPIVWKLPDMWAFCGGEHYTFNEIRYIEGYKSSNKPPDHYGLDIDRFVWLQKKEQWKNIELTIVCPSKWLQKCAKSSYLFKEYPVFNISNPLNLEIYKPAIDIDSVRNHFQLPLDKKIILYSSLQSAKDPRKGYSYLDNTVHELTQLMDPSELCIAIMGIKTKHRSVHGVPVFNLGHLTNDNEIAMGYSSADVCLFPSIADNQPNIIKESMSCGTPCVAFDVGGVGEMISHKINGYLAPAGNISGLVEGLYWTFSQDAALVSEKARKSACELHDHKARVREYMELYKSILGAGNPDTNAS